MIKGNDQEKQEIKELSKKLIRKEAYE